MEESFDDGCFAIRQAARHVSQIYDRHLASVGLTITQFSLLSRLQRTTLVRIVQPLRRNGLVLSEAPPADARALSFSLTSEGHARLEAGWKHWHAAQAEFEHSFGGPRARALRGELFAMTGRL